MNLKEVFERQHRRIYRIAMLMLQNEADAEDAVQNIFIKYYEKSIEFRDDEHENAWFITVTRNYCTDVLKSYWKKQVDMGNIPDTPIEEYEEGELITHVMKLPEKYRDVIYLYYYEEYSVREISNMLDRKESTIQTQLSAARQKLKKILEKECKVYV